MAGTPHVAQCPRTLQNMLLAASDATCLAASLQDTRPDSVLCSPPPWTCHSTPFPFSYELTLVRHAAESGWRGGGEAFVHMSGWSEQGLKRTGASG